ncbi:hypothetical protein [Tumebacillus sp. BK434]|uniref:hypothetical protein n=1 Tax=Tumebacillus sp. BK434 TaxID=2512169 RepID=UPI001043F70B|nr:hypothetical protein [Tumebacillus sp. BK434]
MIMLFQLQKSLPQLQAEVASLPEEIHKGGLQHPMIGVNFQVVLPLPEHVQQRPALVMLASPDCSVCESELIDWLKANEYDAVPFVCYYQHENIDEHNLRVFLDTFAGRVPLQPYPGHLDHRLGIEGSPFVFMIDSNGIVHRVQRPLRSLVKYYRQMKDRV